MIVATPPGSTVAQGIHNLPNATVWRFTHGLAGIMSLPWLMIPDVTASLLYGAHEVAEC